jgi:4-amino-4-deoxy-L-arabinose transferase-like glycosyltransferase
MKQIVFQKKYAYILLAITFIGFFLRIYELGVQSFWLDEAISANAARAIIQQGSPVFPSGIVYGRAILNTYLIATSFMALGINEFAARIPGVLFGTAMIPLSCLVGYKISGKRTGIIAAFFIAFSLWEITWSRQARMYQQLQFFYILSLLALYEFNRKVNVQNFLCMSGAILGAVLSHAFGYVLIPIAFAYSIYIHLIKYKQTLIESFSIFRIMVLISALFAVFISLFFFTNINGIIHSVINTNVNYTDTYIQFLQNWTALFLYLAPLGAIIALKRNKEITLLLIVSYLIPFYIISYHVQLVGYRYLYFIFPILPLLTATLIDHILFPVERLIPTAVKDKKKQFLNLLVVLLILFASLPYLQLTPTSHYDLEPRTPSGDFKGAYLDIKGDDLHPDDAVIAGFTPLAQFYLGRCDYWLMFNVDGRGPQTFMTDDNMDQYANATPIKNVEELQNVLESHKRGWIVIHDMAWVGQTSEMKEFLSTSEDFQLTRYKQVRMFEWNFTE